MTSLLCVAIPLMSSLLYAGTADSAAAVKRELLSLEQSGVSRLIHAVWATQVCAAIPLMSSSYVLPSH